MKRNTLLPVLSFYLILSISVYVIGCESPVDAPLDQVEQIQIIIEPCIATVISDEQGKDYFPETPLVTMDDVTVETGTLDRAYSSPWAGDFSLGEPCFLIKGTIRNGYDEGRWVAYHATGYDDSGNIVSYTLDEGPIIGVAQLYIEGNSSEEFTLHISWSNNTTIFKISSQASEIMFP